MDLETLIKFLGATEVGSRVAGTKTGKGYRFGGIRDYSTKAKKYAHLNGEPVTVLVSEERERSEIVLFVAPLLLFVNATDEELGYGRFPEAYRRKHCLQELPQIPNRYQYKCHYKAVARYVRRATTPRPSP